MFLGMKSRHLGWARARDAEEVVQRRQRATLVDFEGCAKAALRAEAVHCHPVSVKQLAVSLPPTTFKEITWREGTDRKLRSGFAAVRVRVAHRDYEKAEPHAEEWLLIEWPRGEAEPTQYWISTVSPNTKLKALVKIAKHRWIIERDYQELKQE